MEKTSQTILNRVSGQEISFLNPAGHSGNDLLLMEMRLKGIGEPPPMHYHPVQQERFQVMAGCLKVRFADREQVFGPGDTIDIPPNTQHSMWNAHGGDTVVRWEVYPALQTRQFFTLAFSMANARLSQGEKDLGLLQKIFIAGRYADEFRLARPPFLVVQLLYSLLSPFWKVKVSDK